jgi:DNA-binding MarR family transcriptional regulator
MSSDIDLPPPYIGFSMRVVWQWIWDLNMEAATRAGFDDVTSAHVSLFRYPGLDGHRLTDIAQRMQITKQSVHELIGHLERLGYLVREPDPTNRRARLVRLTPKGQRLQEVIRLQAQASEREIAELLGDRRFANLRQALAILVDQIAPDDHDPVPNAESARRR